MYTVLAEGDDLTDPVVDAARACLDGHIVLARRLAQRGHFPAVDVLNSVSRVMTDIVSAGHRELAQETREVLAAYRETADLIEVGAYVAGTNPRVDRSLRCINEVNNVLRQGPGERFTLEQTMAGLKRALAGPAAAPAKQERHD
jgi:flagellum-specific ATP synthase